MSDRMEDAYPLRWPTGRRRTESHKRQKANFGRSTKRGDHDTTLRFRRQLSIAEARTRLIEELERLGAVYWTLSSDLRVRQDGLPYSNQAEPRDPGVALYFQLGLESNCIACDRFDRAADNIAAIAATIDALRGIERWGAVTVDEAFQGTRLALPDGLGPSWVKVLGPCRTQADARAAYRKKVPDAHPDLHPNDPEAAARMRGLGEALRAALAQLPPTESAR